MDNNYLFLAMQTGGQLSPEQLQRAQQMGQLPQMNMGAGLNDIQKKNMQEAQHYGMFRRGGVPVKYAKGGQQEEIDQQYMSPYMQYNQRVSDFLQNLKATAMGALQDEMVGVNDDYAEEANQIEMEQAQYGQQVSQPTLNPQGLNAVNAWMGAAQNRKDMVQPLAETAGLASGLKGYWGSQDDYEANPYNAAWNPTRLTMTDMSTGKKTVTRARRDGFFSQPSGGATQPPANTNEEECTPGTDCFPDNYEYGGQYFQPGGENDPGDYYANGDPEATDANGNLKPGYVTFTGVPEPMGGSPIVPFTGVGGLASQVAGLVRTGKFLSDNLPAPTSPSTGVGPFTGNMGAPVTGSASTGVGPFTGNVGAPAVPTGPTPTFGGVTPNFYSAGLQGIKSQLATGQAMDSYGDKARADEAAYNAEQQRQKDQQTTLEKNAIAMGWVNPDGTADVAGYSAPDAQGVQRWGYKPGFDPNAALPKSVDKKEKQKKDKTASGTGSSSAGTSSAGTPSTPPTGTEVVKNADGTESSLSPEEAARRKADAAAQAGNVVDPGKTPESTTTTTTPAAGTTTNTTTQPNANKGEIDYLRMLADPTSQNAGGVYTTDRNGNPVPMAFYDPNMRLNRMSADYRNNAASWFRKNKKPGQMKSLTFDFSSGTPYTVPGEKAAPQASGPAPITQSPNVNDTTGAKEVTGLTPNPEFNTTWNGMQQAPTYQAPTYPAPVQNVPPQRGPITSMSDLVPNGVEVGPQGNVPANLPTSLPTSVSQAAQQAPLTERQKRQLDRINARTQRKVGNIQADTPTSQGEQSYKPELLESNPAGSIVQGNDGNFYFKDANGEIHSSNNQNSLTKKRDGMGLTGKKYGGILNIYQLAGEFKEEPNFFETGLLPQPEQSNYMSPALPGETVIEHDKYMRAKYDKNKKSNPFFAPAMLAGLNTLAGAAQNMDAKAKENQLRGKLSYDQIYAANPETSGNRGDWTFNEGYIRPNDMVPTQFTGNGMQMAQFGGSAYEEGDELYLDEDAIQAFLAAGGELDYLD